MEIIIKCSDDVRGGTNIYGEPIRELVRCKECKFDETRRCPMYSAKFGYCDEDYCSCGERKGE